MNYTINWSDNTLKPPFTVLSGDIDTTTSSLSLIGNGSIFWGEKLQENMLHLLENFASSGTPPLNPTIGQLWFNNTTKELKIYYNSSWNDAILNTSWSRTGPNVTIRTVTDKLRESIPSTNDYTVLPTPSSPNFWVWDYNNIDGSSQQRLIQSIPSSVNMVGGGAVQGVGLTFVGNTSAQSPNAGLAETNAIRIYYKINADAGSKVQSHLINGLLETESNENGTGNEHAVIIGTSRAIGPIGSGTAQGVWGGDLHVEKTANVRDGAMCALEIGVHKAPALGAAKNRGIDLWSGNRSGIIATRAGDALYIQGTAGWTNYLKFMHTDNTTVVSCIDQNGNLILRNPIGNHSTFLTTNQNNTSSTLELSGRTSGAALVNAAVQAESSGQVIMGATTNHDTIIVSNNVEILRAKKTGQTHLKPIAALPTGAAGDLVYINTTNKHYGHNGTSWQELGNKSNCIFELMTDAQIADVEAGTLTINLSTVFANAATVYRGKKVYLPKGKYLINATAASIVLKEITFIGENVLDGDNILMDQGSIICIKGTVNSPFKIRRGVTFDGIGFYYPDQVDSLTPTVYPPMLDFDFTDGAVQFVYFRNNVVFNAYSFCKINDIGGGVGHIWFTNNTIYGISSCFDLTHNAEVIKIIGNTFSFGHWLAATESGCRRFTRENGEVFKMPRTDGFIFTDNLVFGYLKGINFATTALCQLMNVSDNLFDQVRYPIIADGAGNLSGAQITGNSFIAFNATNTTQGGNAIKISTNGVLATETLIISGNTFSTTSEEHILITGNTPTRIINLSSNTFTSWAAFKASGNYGAINITANNTSFTCTGNYIASQNVFGSGILGSASAAVITGNSFLNCINPINAAYSSGSCAGNASYSTIGSISDLTVGLVQAGNTWDKPNNFVNVVTAATYTPGINFNTAIFNFAGTVTVTLPNAVTSAGRIFKFRNLTANTVISASSNVVPITGGAAGTAILPATIGSWVELISDGTAWQIIAS